MVEETVAGVRVVKGFGAEARAVRQAAQRGRRHPARVGARRRASGPRYLPAIDLLPQHRARSRCSASAATQVLNGDMTVGELVAFNFYVALLVWPLRTLGMTLAWGQRAAAALERVHEVLATGPDVGDPGRARSPAARPQPLGAVAVRRRRRSATTRPSRPAGARRLRHSSSRAGESVALVGATGSGKSTVARLLLRFYDVDARRASRSTASTCATSRCTTCGSAVGIVFEDTFLFHDTVARQHRLRRSRRADADADRARRPAGRRPRLHRGAARGLRHGDRRARLLAVGRPAPAHRHRPGDPRRPAVLVLDDATSSVDPSKEHEIRDALADGDAGAHHDRHRPPAGTIALADTVVLLDGGRVVADGHPRASCSPTDRALPRRARAAMRAPSRTQPSAGCRRPRRPSEAAT